MISDAGIKAAEAALNSAIRLRNSTFAELGCGMLAAIIAILNIAVLWKSAATHWAFQDSSLTPAGWLCLAIGNTLFWFLLVRLIWRHVVWSVFANKISKCGLRIVVSHPDGHASLSFLTVYPTGYTFFTLGVSSVVAAGLARQLHASSLSFSTFTAICTAWLVLVAGFFALPLVGFVVQIMRLKSDTIDLALRPILNRERSLERKMLGRNVSCGDPASNEATGEDARQAYDAAIKCSALLLNKANVVPLLAGALLPIALVGLTQFPFSELGPLLRRLLFL